jgi:[acyl-carrier-protein] S-malonyltransferase
MSAVVHGESQWQAGDASEPSNEGRTVYLFPGQGSQVRGMRERVRQQCPELLDLACEVVGQDPFESARSSTRFLQPAIFCASIAGWRRARELDGPHAADPAGFAGHSLGELAALVAAEAISTEDGLRLVALRGALMERAGAANAEGGMLAVLGADLDVVSEVAASTGLTLANDNAPGEIVLAGGLDDIERAIAMLTEREIRTLQLAVKGAFHSPAMAPACEPLERALRDIAWSTPIAPVYSGVTAAPFDDIPLRLAQSLTQGVRWRETLLRLRATGVRRYVEVGPGRVLTKLVRRTLPSDHEALTIDNFDGAWPNDASARQKETVRA